MTRILTVIALCTISLIACNRDSGVDPGPGPGAEDMAQAPRARCPGCTEFTPLATPPGAPECGFINQPCCPNGDGLACNEGLTCVGSEVCQVVDTDLGSPACGGYGQGCCMGDICGDGLACNPAGLCDLVVTPPDGGVDPGDGGSSDPGDGGSDDGGVCIDTHKNHLGLGHLKCKGLGHCK